MITRLKRMTEIASEVLSVVGGLAVGMLVLIVAYSSISRYVFGRAVNYMNEVAGLFLMVACFVSFPYVFVKGGHIHVGLILERFSGKVRGYMELGNRIILLFYLIIFVEVTYDFVANSYRFDCHTADSNIYEVPWMAVMPISGLIFALVVLISCVERIWNIITGKKEGIEVEKTEATGEETKIF